MRRLYVQQRENDHGEFWYVLKGRRYGRVTATSETYPTRSNAIRAARRFIASIDPVPVEFTYVVGPRPERDPNGTLRDWRRERVRC